MIIEQPLFDFVAEITYTNSILYKKAIIQKYSDNELIKDCLRFLLDVNIKTGISKKKIEKEVTVFREDVDYCKLNRCYNLYQIMNYLKSNNTGKGVDILITQNYLLEMEQRGCSVAQAKILSDLLTKSLKLGVDTKIVNSVIPGLIPTFDIMLGTAFENANFKEGSYFYLTRKLNGTRCIYYKGKLYSRQGKEYTGLDHIITCVKDILHKEHREVDDVVFDGELLLDNSDGKYSDSEAFQIGTGLANSKDKDKSSLMYMVFDILPVKCFERGECDQVYSERLKCRQRLSELVTQSDPVQFLPVLYNGTDSSKIWEWLDYAEKNDWEGVMLNLNTPYEFKRTKNLIKVKRFYTMDLPVINIERGTGRNKDRMGAIICEYKDNIVKVGSGFSDELRDSIWIDPSIIVGKIVEVKYKEKTTNKFNGESLQFPVFVRIRDISYD